MARRRKTHKRRPRRGGGTNENKQVRFNRRVGKRPSALTYEETYPGPLDQYFTQKMHPVEPRGTAPDCEATNFRVFPCHTTMGSIGEYPITLNDVEEYRRFQEADKNSTFNSVTEYMRSDDEDKYLKDIERPFVREYQRANNALPKVMPPEMEAMVALGTRRKPYLPVPPRSGQREGPPLVDPRGIIPPFPPPPAPQTAPTKGFFGTLKHSFHNVFGSKKASSGGRRSRRRTQLRTRRHR